MIVNRSFGKGSTTLDDEKRLHEARQYWDDQALAFDDEPDHGLRDPGVLEAWSSFLAACIPYTGGTILDIGCGTGSLSIVLARLGHDVTGIDLSPSMISLARAKAATLGFPIEFHVMDAALPPFLHEQFDAIVCRHLLWTLPEPGRVLERWSALLKPKGRLVLIEGYWATGAGLHASEIIEILPASLPVSLFQNLSKASRFWGREVSDERYVILADKER